ncbi:M20/M25/M40 family metallo-hydrolase [Mucilaginibacter myungsuensis]|uniref:Carboxypeptidase Q n=1 Tax=Mucilaginibacter myungsuensis TaxID=649104 RepID=A0A929PUU4_9SPHI|nr:M20/M25/M40 family metallo-hydrolase [Mucilaginibacter myungsuensis]MBE9660454.1 M20/M25/M40 family metallo-hydrolase [Mucilaginibacter myungsuensis]MDN3600496.1 M20/M25/M40 family metallo-hydrolase [Mucilaginibacter myungsuensis]
MKNPHHYTISTWQKAKPIALGLLLCSSLSFAQSGKPVIDAIVKESTNNSQLEKLAHELFDKIGPRLVGTPQMKTANDWAVAKYKSWGIDARNEKWGQWRGWERGVTHIDMISPRVRSLEGTMLAWSPGTGKKTVTADVILLPEVADSLAFVKWLPSVKGKFVMVSANQVTGRPAENLKEFAFKETIDKFKADQAAINLAWAKRVKATGHTAKTLAVALENAGAVGVVTNYWSAGFGVDKIFGANTKKVPSVDISLEDYTLLYRLIENGTTPKISLHCESKDMGVVPTFNTIAEIKGSEKPDEYVILSAHFDSWDAASGATDNGTGTLTMMEAMRILKLVYPNPKRTILVGHWGSEEQGLNGSKSFVEDHPEIVKNLQALFNQDNGTGRVVNISGQGFADSKNFIPRWLAPVPDTIKNRIKTSFPGSPSAGGSDNASFVMAGAPGISLGSLGWAYGNYTWHTNRDTYDKVVFEEVRNNAMLAAMLAYMASEDPQKTSTEKAEGIRWPGFVKPNRGEEFKK